jgi:hypothetical protein
MDTSHQTQKNDREIMYPQQQEMGNNEDDLFTKEEEEAEFRLP